MSDYNTTVIRERVTDDAEHLDSEALEREEQVAPAAAPRRSAGLRLSLPKFSSSPSSAVWAGLVVVVLGFATIFFSWVKVAATLDVGRQMPYVVSGAMTGLGLIVVGIAVADMAVRRQDRMERRHQLALMRTLLEEMREVLEPQDGQDRA
ncbi:MAG: hypothetical protein WB767_05390 [Nocardioides sp.]